MAITVSFATAIGTGFSRGALIGGAVVQTIPTGAVTEYTQTMAIIHPEVGGSFFRPLTNDHSLFAAFGGWYYAVAFANWDIAAGGYREGRFFVNGLTPSGNISTRLPPVSGDNTHIVWTMPLRLSVNDRVSVAIRQTSGGNVDMETIRLGLFQIANLT